MDEAKRGVFWVVDGALAAFPFDPRMPVGVAKSGNTYNHRKLWEELRLGKEPCNYHPRGRVDVSRSGKATVYVNPNIAGEPWLSQVRAAFGIEGDYRVCVDCSAHYRCHLDEGWEAGS